MRKLIFTKRSENRMKPGHSRLKKFWNAALLSTGILASVALGSCTSRLPPIIPIKTVPTRILKGVRDGPVAFTEKEWSKKLKLYTERICRGKSRVGAAYAIYKAINTLGGTLGIKYEKSQEHSEGTVFRGIDVFAKNRGDCDEVSYLFVMMARHAGLEAHTVDVYVDNYGLSSEFRGAGHSCAAIFVRGPRPRGAYGRFETDHNFRKKTLKNLGRRDSKDLHLILVDMTYSGGFGVQHKEVKVQTDNQMAAIYHRDMGHVYAERNRLEDGIREYRTAIKLDPKEISIRYGLVSILRQKKVKVWSDLSVSLRGRLRKLNEKYRKGQARVHERFRKLREDYRRKYEEITRKYSRAPSWKRQGKLLDLQLEFQDKRQNLREKLQDIQLRFNGKVLDLRLKFQDKRQNQQEKLNDQIQDQLDKIVDIRTGD